MHTPEELAKYPPTKGTRVQLREEFDCFPTGLFPKGLTGTVYNVEEDIIAVRLDYDRRELDEWSNELHCTPDRSNYEEPLILTFWKIWEPEQEEIDGLGLLTDEFTKWCNDHRMPHLSADELYLGMLDDEDPVGLDGQFATEAEKEYVQGFCERWDHICSLETARRDFYKAVAEARHPDEEWGSETQIESENALHELVEQLLTPEEFEDFERYAHRANVFERTDYAVRLCEAAFAREVNDAVSP